MSTEDVAGAGPIGGASDELGGQLRASLAAWFMAHAATGRCIPALDMADELAVPTYVRVETDEWVDDLEVGFIKGSRAFVQCKARLQLERAGSSTFGRTVAQWTAQVEQGLDDGDRLVVATSSASREIRALAAALDRRRDRLSGRERRAMDVLCGHLAIVEPLRSKLLEHASILVLDLNTEGIGRRPRTRPGRHR